MSNPGAATPHLERRIGLFGAAALVVGAVIGGGIYVLVADIATLTGNALWLAFSIATLISVVGVLPLIQLSGALPRDGAGFFFVSRMLSPYWGMLTSYLVILGGASSTCVVALTMAKLLPESLLAYASFRVWSVVIVLAFYVIYQFGVQFAMSLQAIMAAQLLVALGVYVVVAVSGGHAAFGFEAPQGNGGMLQATLLCYMTCMGFQVVAELGEEVRNARRNIPLSLIIGGGTVALIYIFVGSAFVGTIPYASYTGANAALATRPTLNNSAVLLLPGWFLPFFALGAWSAGLTSLNAAALSIPREIFAQARDGIMPALLGRISARTHAPQHAVTIFFVLVCVMLCASADIDFYGLMAAIGILEMSAILCVASLPLRKRFPERYRSAFIVFPQWVLLACTIFTVLVSLAFLGVLASLRPGVLAVYGIYACAASAYYFVRTRSFTSDDWARLRAVPGEDEAA